MLRPSKPPILQANFIFRVLARILLCIIVRTVKEAAMRDFEHIVCNLLNNWLMEEYSETRQSVVNVLTCALVTARLIPARVESGRPCGRAGR